MRTLHEIIRQVFHFMNEWEIFYCIVDDLALAMYGFSEEPNQIDMLVNTTEEYRDMFVRFLKAEDYEMLPSTSGKFGIDGVTEDIFFRDIPKPWLLRRAEAQGIMHGDPVKINLFSSRDLFDMSTIGRRVLVQYAHTSVFVASHEDMIIREIKKGSKKNMKMAREIYLTWKNHLDLGYMVNMTMQLDIYKTFIKMKKKMDKKKT
jgi:hypothetical protein